MHSTSRNRIPLGPARKLPPLVALAVLLAAALLASAPPSARADVTLVPAACPPAPCGCQPCHRTGDQLWLLDDRHSGCLDDSADATASLRYWRYDEKTSDWRPAKAADFYRGPGTNLPLCVWVHGNRIGDSGVYDVGEEVYHALLRGHCDAPPLKFVIWSWPASLAYRRPLPDVRLKEARIAATAFRLGTVLSRLPSDPPRSLIGYSFGSRIVSGALSTLGGAEIAGHRLAKVRAAARPWRAVLMASATDYDWLEPGKPHGRALSQVDHLLLLNNSCDMVLKHYELLPCDRCGPPALGYEGIESLKALGPDSAKVRQVDAAPYVGKRHDWRRYVGAEELMRQVRDLVLPTAKPSTVKPSALKPSPAKPHAAMAQR